MVGVVGAGGEMYKVLYDANEDGVFEGSTMQLLKKYTISDTLQLSHDVPVTHDTTTITKKKTITLDTIYPTPSTLRIKFDLKSSQALNVMGRIYKNGAEFGTLRVNGTTSYVTYSEDLSFAEGDTLELWLDISTTPLVATAINLRVYGTEHVRTLQEAITASHVGVSDPLAGTNT